MRLTEAFSIPYLSIPSHSISRESLLERRGVRLGYVERLVHEVEGLDAVRPAQARTLIKGLPSVQIRGLLIELEDFL